MIAINYELLKTAQELAEFAVKFHDEIKWKSAMEAWKEAHGYKEVTDAPLH